MTDTEAGRRSQVSTVSVSASIKALRQGCSLKSFLCSEDRGLAEEAGCRRLRAEEAERPAPCYSAAAALPFKQQPQHQSSELSEQGSMFPGNKGLYDDNLYLLNHYQQNFL